MSLEASFYGGPLLRAAAWNRRAGMHELGAGPTIMSTVATSADEFDLAFVQAAARGETDSVAALIPRVSSIDVLVRPLQGLRTKGRPASALHSAAAVGSEEVVSLLIQNGAEVSKRMHWLRALTPLHVAATPAVAHLLLSAGAQPIALDPREPDPTWYHRVQGREQVAKAIDEWRRAHLNPTPSPPSPRAAAFVSVGPMKTIPALSAAEVKAVASVWSVLHIEAVEAVAKLWQSTLSMRRRRRSPSAHSNAASALASCAPRHPRPHRSSRSSAYHAVPMARRHMPSTSNAYSAGCYARPLAPCAVQTCGRCFAGTSPPEVWWRAIRDRHQQLRRWHRDRRAHRRHQRHQRR